jgi:hypothetical protein
MVEWEDVWYCRRLHDRGAMDLVPHRWTDGDHAGGSMEIKHVDEETISYHALFTFDVIMQFLFVLVFRYTMVS